MDWFMCGKYLMVEVLRVLNNWKIHIATHIHIFWTWPKLSAYWREVFEALEFVFQQNIPREPTVALLGMIPEGLEGRAKKYLLNVLLTAALKSITIRWLKSDPPTYNIWIQKVWDLYQMEQITYTLRLQRPIFAGRWSPVMPLLMQWGQLLDSTHAIHHMCQTQGPRAKSGPPSHFMWPARSCKKYNLRHTSLNCITAGVQ